MNWEPLLRKFVLGTQREPFNDADINEIRVNIGVSGFSIQEEEIQLLETATLYHLVQKAGRHLPLADAAQTPQPVEPEVHLFCTAAVGAALKSVLNSDQEELCLEFLCLLAKAQLSITPSLLPLLLDKAKEHQHLLVVLPEVLGNRGIWLARNNPQWRHLLPDDKDSSAFFNDSLSQQITHLLLLRARKSPKVHPYLESLWQTQNSASRAKLLSLLAVNISKNDIPILEKCVSDKSKEVQRKAISLLSLLPSSAHINSMTERLAALITGNWADIQLPQPSPEIEQNLLDVPYPDWKASEQEYLLARLIAVVPPQWWIDRWGEPENMLKNSAKHPLQKILWWGWQQAAIKFEHADWLVALYKTYAQHSQGNSPFLTEQLLEKVYQSPEAFHALAKTLLDENESHISDEHPLVDFINHHCLPLRDDLVKNIVRRIQARIKSDTYFMDWGLQGMMKHLAYFVNPNLYEWIRGGWDEQSVAWASWRNTVGQFINTIQLRFNFYNNIKVNYYTVISDLNDIYNLTLNKKSR